MLEAVGTGISKLISWIGEVIKAIVTVGGEGTAAGAFNELLPLIGLAIGATVLFLGVKLVRSLAWGF